MLFVPPLNSDQSRKLLPEVATTSHSMPSRWLWASWP